jgi:uncharacterized protein (TIGR03435 family)
MPLMSSLLVSRFGLAFHHETKEGPVYSLVAAKNGAKLHPNTGTPGHSTDWGKDDINAMDVTLAELAEVLEQYGLRLVATRGPVEMTVIDRVERPTGN